ncbi:MAG: glycosyltransferase family 39 protein [Alphaproteobacteria bacterium]|nr:glycosyltransferase family 39 protein [Alphaproteobacteria bacterium]
MAKSKALWALVLGFVALHVALAMWLPLVEDEAYYQLWSRVPSAGYYDHPPMVAWGIAAGQAVFGETLLGVRAASILAAALVVLLTYRIAWLFARDEGVAFRAALWGAVMLPFAALGFAATPDAGSVLFWSAAAWALVEVLQGDNRNWWLLVGLFAGLGVLSKFTNLFFGVGLVLWLVASREGRPWLRVWQVWAGALIGLGVLVPLALWNMRNGFVGLERQFGRIGDANGFSVGDFAAFWASPRSCFW